MGSQVDGTPQAISGDRETPATSPVKSVKKLKTSKKTSVNVEELKRQHSYPLRQKKMETTKEKVTCQMYHKSCNQTNEFMDLGKVKSVEYKKFNDMKIEDIFWNSAYFKSQSGNVSSLSFCSGDNAENRWTVGSASGRRKFISVPSKFYLQTKWDRTVSC